MNLSDLVYAIQQDIGDLMEDDEDIDPTLMVRVNGIVTKVTEIAVNGREITFAPREI